MLSTRKSALLTLLVCAVVALATAAAASAAGGLTPDSSSLDFGSQDIHSGASNQQSVKLSNSTGADVNVSSVSITGADAADFSVAGNDCGTVSDGSSCGVSVQFDPSTSGAKAAQLEVADDLGTLDIPLTGTGETGTLTGSPPSYNLQPYFYGSQSQNANVSNNSSYSVTAIDATITGADAAYFSIDYNGCNFTLSPGTNCSVGVRFNPVAGGTKTAQLELTNDGTTSPLVIPLSATALTGPAAALSPDSHDFGNVAIGSSAAPQPFDRLGVTPRALSSTPDGVHTLRITAGSTSATTRIGLSSCRLAVRLEGGRGHQTAITLSAAVGMTDPKIHLPGSLRLTPGAGRIGEASVKAVGEPAQTFALFGARTSSNGMTVSLSRSGATVTGLPSEVGVIRLTLDADVIGGSGGTVRASAPLRADTARSGNRTPAIWRR